MRRLILFTIVFVSITSLSARVLRQHADIGQAWLRRLHLCRFRCHTHGDTHLVQSEDHLH